jgi:DNA-binding response OmpR family regulator
LIAQLSPGRLEPHIAPAALAHGEGDAMRSAEQAILLVEHDEPTRELYLRELSRDFCVYAYAGCDAATVLELLRMHDIRALVLEPGLAGEGGWALLAELKRAADTRAMPVILCSSLDERKRGLELGASAYLVKPVLPATLLEAVRQITGQPPRERRPRRALSQP